MTRLDETLTRAFIADRPVHSGFDVDDSTWATGHLVCVGPVDDATSHAAALDVALRGADVAADVSAERSAAFLDDVRRAGLTVWEPQTVELDAETIALLDEMAQGASVSLAARRCNLSERSAHRRLATARTAIGVATTAEVIKVWSARQSDSGSRR